MSCSHCGETLTFLQKGSDSQVHWLLVGGRQGPPRAALPIPRDIKLTIGSTPDQWLTLPGDEIGSPHAEIMLGADDKLRVWHAKGATGTWINAASIHEGVLRPQDSLFIGPYRLRVSLDDPSKKTAKQRSRAADSLEETEPTIVIEDASDTDDSSDVIGRPDRDDGPTVSKGRIVLIAAVLMLALGYLTWWLMAPKFSKDMPTETNYRCPADGTVVRGGWQDGFPKCPQCGALCVGGLRYKAERTDGPPPTTAPSAPTTSAPHTRDRGP